MDSTERLLKRLEAAYDKYVREYDEGKEMPLPDFGKILRSEPDQAVRNEVVNQLILRLTDHDGTLSSKYRTILVKIGPDALPELVKAMRYRRTARDLRFDGRGAARRSRANAAFVIGEIGNMHGDVPGLDKKTIMDIVRLLKVGDARDPTIKALAGIRDPLAAEAIARLFNKKDWALKRAAAKALGGMGEAGLPHLLAALENPDKSVRSSAAKALYNKTLGIPRCWDALRSPGIHAVSALAARLEDDADEVAKFSYRILDATLDAAYEKEKIVMFMEELAEGYTRLLEKRPKAGMQEPGLEQEFSEVAGRMRSVSAASVLISTLKGDGSPVIMKLSAKALAKVAEGGDAQKRKEMTNGIIEFTMSEWFMAEMRRNSPAYEMVANTIAGLLSKLKASEQRDVMLEPKIPRPAKSKGTAKQMRLVVNG